MARNGITGSGMMRLTRWAAALWLLATAPAAWALFINSYTGNEAAYNRFASGYSSAPVNNTSTAFIGAGYDWSGVGWSAVNSNQSVAMLSPQHVLYAAHYTPSTTLRFTAGAGTITSATVKSYSGALVAGQDLAVGTLSAPVSSTAGIATYALWFQGYNATPYVGKSLLVYGMSARIGKANVNSFWVNTGTDLSPDTTTVRKNLLMFTNTPATQGAGYCNFQVGDSGSPTFYTSPEGKLVLTGVHYAVSSTASGQASYASWDSMAAGLLPELNLEMAKTGWLPEVYTPATNTWTGGGSGNNWGTSSNWLAGQRAADVMTTIGSETLVWTAAAARFDNNQTSKFAVTLNGVREITGLIFTGSGSGKFAFSGNALTLGEAGIHNQTTVTHTLGMAVSLRTAQRWNADTGGLAVTGSVNNNGNLLFVTGSANTTISGVLSGAGGLGKDGAGTLFLTASNLYSGSSFVHAGTVSAGNAAALGTGGILVESGGRLEIAAGVTFTRSVTFQGGAAVGGRGTYAPVGGFTVASGVHVAPGASPGTLTVGNVTFQNGSFLDIELAGGIPGTTYDQLISTGTMTLTGGTMNVSFLDGYKPAPYQEYHVLNWAYITGTFFTVNLPTLDSGWTWDSTKLYTTGLLVAVPEPTAALLFLAGAAALAARRRHRPGAPPDPDRFPGPDKAG